MFSCIGSVALLPLYDYVDYKQRCCLLPYIRASIVIAPFFTRCCCVFFSLLSASPLPFVAIWRPSPGAFLVFGSVHSLPSVAYDGAVQTCAICASKCIEPPRLACNHRAHTNVFFCGESAEESTCRFCCCCVGLANRAIRRAAPPSRQRQQTDEALSHRADARNTRVMSNAGFLVLGTKFSCENQRSGTSATAALMINKHCPTVFNQNTPNYHKKKNTESSVSATDFFLPASKVMHVLLYNTRIYNLIKLIATERQCCCIVCFILFIALFKHYYVPNPRTHIHQPFKSETFFSRSTLRFNSYRYRRARTINFSLRHPAITSDSEYLKYVWM